MRVDVDQRSALVSNVMVVLKASARTEGVDRATIVLAGTAESFSSLVLAFLLLIAALMLAASGAARVAIARKGVPA